MRIKEFKEAAQFPSYKPLKFLRQVVIKQKEI